MVLMSKMFGRLNVSISNDSNVESHSIVWAEILSTLKYASAPINHIYSSNKFKIGDIEDILNARTIRSPDCLLFLTVNRFYLTFKQMVIKTNAYFTHT